MPFFDKNVLALTFMNVITVLLGQIAHAKYRRMKQFQFWNAFHALRRPTDLVSFGQVEASD